MALGVSCEQQAEKRKWELDEDGLDEGDDELRPGRRGKDVEPGIDEQQCRGCRRRTFEPWRSPPGRDRDGEQEQREDDVEAAPGDVPMRRSVCRRQKDHEQHDGRHEHDGRQREQRHDPVGRTPAGRGAHSGRCRYSAETASRVA
jgi:hypothetical protein